MIPIRFLFLIFFLIPIYANIEEWRSPHDLKHEENAPVALIPFPSKVTWSGGHSPKSTKITTKITPIQGNSLEKEGYELVITPNQIIIKAASETGVFYAQKTLEQLDMKDKYPCCHIIDKPAFSIRGFMHDTGRNFQTIESLKEQLDIMSRFKVNVFHWHLTDYPAWRIECKKYPVLNDPSKRRPGRDVNDTYSYEQIRDLFNFAKERHIQIIPEIDMPGHSEYFVTCFGVKMHTEKGMNILEALLEEFCREIPQEMSPYLHIGADEIRIPNAREFVERMTSKVKSLGRQPIQWAGLQDLPVSSNSYSHLWNDENSIGLPVPNKQPTPYFDSTAGYINSFDPAILVRRHFFRQPCGQPVGDEKALGVIACLWPDIRVGNKKNIPIQSPQWPAILTMAERAWKGLPFDGSRYAGSLPPKNTEAYKAFHLFEKRLQQLKSTLPFPYWSDSEITWTVYGPTKELSRESIRDTLLSHITPSGIKEKEVIGGNLYFRTRAGSEGIFPETAPGHVAWARTNIYAPKSGTMYAIIGFDAPGRATKRFSGIPLSGEWSQCETKVWVNGKEIKNPQNYILAGKGRFEQHTWHKPTQEIPLENEEFWWTHNPIPIPVKKGKNEILIEQPYIGSFQSWGVTFIPVKKVDASWITDNQYLKTSSSGQ